MKRRGTLSWPNFVAFSVLGVVALHRGDFWLVALAGALLAWGLWGRWVTQ